MGVGPSSMSLPYKLASFCSWVINVVGLPSSSPVDVLVLGINCNTTEVNIFNQLLQGRAKGALNSKKFKYIIKSRRAWVVYCTILWVVPLLLNLYRLNQHNSTFFNLVCVRLLHAWHHHMTVSSAQSTTQLLQVVTCEICTHETVGLVIGDTKVPAGGSWWKSRTTKNWSQTDGHVTMFFFLWHSDFEAYDAHQNVTTYLVQEWMAYIKKSDAIAVRKKSDAMELALQLSDTLLKTNPACKWFQHQYETWNQWTGAKHEQKHT